MPPLRRVRRGGVWDSLLNRDPPPSRAEFLFFSIHFLLKCAIITHIAKKRVKNMPFFEKKLILPIARSVNI